MLIKKCIQSVLLSFSVFAFAGCASTEQHVHLPDVTRPIDDPGMARIYVFRTYIMGAAVPISVFDGNSEIGVTGPNGYVCWERPPGQVLLQMGAQGYMDQFVLNAVAGHAYYFESVMQMVDPPELEQIDDAKGRKDLRSCESDSKAASLEQRLPVAKAAAKPPMKIANLFEHWDRLKQGISPVEASRLFHAWPFDKSPTEIEQAMQQGNSITTTGSRRELVFGPGGLQSWK
jgi:hypothetical protein